MLTRLPARRWYCRWSDFRGALFFLLMRFILDWLSRTRQVYILVYDHSFFPCLAPTPRSLGPTRPPPPPSKPDALRPLVRLSATLLAPGASRRGHQQP